jgi:hypothetical protein
MAAAASGHACNHPSNRMFDDGCFEWWLGKAGGVTNSSYRPVSCSLRF